VIVYDKKKNSSPFGLWRFARQLNREKFDSAILFQNAIEAAIMAFFAGIPKRIGYRTDVRGLFLTHGVAIGDKERQLHHTDYYCQMLERAGIHGDPEPLKLWCNEEEQAVARELVGDTPYAVINPGAAYGSAKRWFPERFAEVADHIADTYGFKIILTGGPGEMEVGVDITRMMKAPVQNLVGKTSVRDMMAVLAKSQLVVTNDSGPMHVAAAFNTPIVAVFGPTDHTTTSPRNKSFRIVRKECECAPCLLRQCPTDHHCMTAITADDVLAAVRDLLGARA
jgi:heptosyltransferase-2